MIINALSKDAHYFTLDVHNGAILTEPLKFKQHDNNSRVLAIELTMHDDMKVDLRDARVDIWVYKQDGHSVVKAVDRDNIDLVSSIVMIPLTRQMLAVAPSIQCEIVVTYADKSVLSFPIFTVEIEESNVDTDTLVSSSEFDLFYDALYRMEQWMRDYLVKYDTIDRAFKQKLEAIEQERVRIIADFERLNSDLIIQNRTDFEELKQATIGEFNTWLREAKALFALAGREIEKRFNELEQKATDLCNDIEKMKNTSNENLQVILGNRAESDKQLETIIANTTESREQLDAVGELMNETEHRIETLEGRMDEFDEHYRQAKADELLRTQAENARKSAEEIRVTQESLRVNSETRRIESENTRLANEEVRVEAEDLRVEAETERIANEEDRKQGYATMQDQIIDIDEKVDPFSATVSVSPSVAEKGSTVSEIVVKWNYNKGIVTQSINGGDVPISDRTKAISGEFTTNEIVTLKATSVTKRTISKNATLTFKNGIYYGASSSETYDSNLIGGLTKVLDENKARTITVNAGSGQYIYYSYPSRLGTASFNVGGFDGGFNEVARINFINASGYTEEYIIYKSTNANLGNTTVVIK